MSESAKHSIAQILRCDPDELDENSALGVTPAWDRL